MTEHKPKSFFSRFLLFIFSILCCGGWFFHNTGLGLSHSSVGILPNNINRPCDIDSSWHLTFDDEFNGTTVDWSKWKDGGQNFETEPQKDPSKEQEFYVPDAYQFSNGILRIRADRRKVHGQPYASGQLDTIGTFKQTFGYFEARAKLPNGKGLWPQFWLYDATEKSAYEIDPMESLGNNTNVYYMTYHRPSGTPQKAYTGVDLSADFHTYAVKWIRGLIIFCLDNVEQFIVTKDVFRKPVALFLDLAVGGTWAKSPNSSTPFPSYFDVDYVRAYAMPGDNSNPTIKT